MSNKPITPEEMKAYVDATWEKCQAEAWQEPVAWRWKERINDELGNWVVTSCEPPPYAVEKQPLYTAPRQWQGLTKEEAKEICMANRPYVIDMVAALEARLKEKNT